MLIIDKDTMTRTVQIVISKVLYVTVSLFPEKLKSDFILNHLSYLDIASITSLVNNN